MRRAVIAVGAVAVLVVGGLVVAHAVTGEGSSMVASQSSSPLPGAAVEVPPSGSAAVAAAAGPGPTAAAAVGGGGVDVDGARVAAVAAVARTREVAEAGGISRRDVIAEFATAGFAPVLAERTSLQLVELLFGLRRAAGRSVAVEVLAQPVTATATPLSAGRVLVEVWTVTVIVAEGESPVPEQWSTFRLEMAEVGGRWLVDGWEATAGPSPAPAPEGSFASDVEVAAVMAWTPAGVGGG